MSMPSSSTIENGGHEAMNCGFAPLIRSWQGYYRAIMIRAQDQYEALQAARQRQATATFKAQYAARAGIEGTISQGTRTGDLRRSRYIGLAKTTLHHLLLATGINLLRVCAWLADVPRSRTRRSAFALLAVGCT